MSGSWYFRLSVIVAALLASVYVLLPTFMQSADFEAIAEQVDENGGVPVEDATDEEAEDAAPTTWEAMLPSTRLNLGLDLKGGIDLTLDVDMDEAVLSSVARDVLPIQDFAEEEGLKVLDVRRQRGEAVIDVVLGEGVELSDFRQAVMSKRFSEYAYAGSKDGVHSFELTDDARTAIEDGAIEQAVEMLRNRVNETGVKEPTIVRKGDSRINVQLPGVQDAKAAVDALGTTAELKFYMVDEQFQTQALEAALAQAKEAMAPEDYADDRTLNYWLQDNGKIGTDNVVLWQQYEDGSPSGLYTEIRGKKNLASSPLVLMADVILTGDDVNDANQAYDQNGQPVVSLEFKPKGAKIFGDVTGAHVDERFAIVLDEIIESAPNINERIGGGRAQISMGQGGYEAKLNDARTLSLVLRTGALPAPINVGEVRVVGAQLGQDAIDAGSKAVLIGGILVFGFMLLYYRKPGIVANMGLALNVFFVLALLAVFDATLTLPGIAGIALTVGMAVDANIIIYERIREEQENGKNARQAVDAGYKHALSAVLDANITTGIAGVVLYSYGTGPIKGFAVTLLVGIITTLFTAIFVSRTFMDFLVRKSTARLAF
jgi:preprotein translocase subunit SecD